MGGQRCSIHLCRQERGNPLHPRKIENRARDCQEMRELRRICCKQADTARQFKLDELSMSTVNQLLSQIQDLQNKVYSLKDAIEFYDYETASSSGASHVPSQPSDIPSRGMLCRDHRLPLDTLNIVGASGNVFDSLPAREGPSSALFEHSRNFASSSCGLGSGNLWNIGKE